VGRYDGANGLYVTRDSATIVINKIMYPIFDASIVTAHANWALITRDLPSEPIQLVTFVELFEVPELHRVAK
jgi:hypothetical protein